MSKITVVLLSQHMVSKENEKYLIFKQKYLVNLVFEKQAILISDKKLMITWHFQYVILGS